MTQYYWTWPDRGLTYDCRSCGACCQGLGIGFDTTTGEFEAVLQHYPDLAPFVRQRGATWTAFNPKPRCWFLEHNGLCHLESTWGRALKPATCRLFPFNRVFAAEGWTVIDYNSVICPLELSDRQGPSHTALLDEITAIGDPGIVKIALDPLRVAGDIHTTLSAEQQFSQRCFAALNSTQCAADTLRALSQQSPANKPQEAAAIAAACTWLFGGADLPQGDQARRALLATPSLRFNEIFGPRPIPHDGWAHALAAQWRVWLHGIAAGARLAKSPLSLQQITTIWAELAPLGRLLARWHQPHSLQQGAIAIGGDGQPRQDALNLLQAMVGDARAIGPLAEWLLGDRNHAHRVATMRLVADALMREPNNTNHNDTSTEKKPRRKAKRKLKRR